MMMKITISKSKFFVLIFLIVSINSCSSSKDPKEFIKAQSYEQTNEPKKAIQYYLRTINRYPEKKISVKAAEHIVRLARIETKNYSLAIKSLNFILKNSKNLELSIWAQELKANIYYENLYQYNKAIIEFNKFLSLIKKDKKLFKIKLRLAKCHFSLNQFYQSEIEVNEALKLKVSKGDIFEALLFKASLYLTNKKVDKAILLYKDLLKKYPDLSKKENIKTNLAVCYEEKEEFNEAIRVLKEIKDEKIEKAEIVDLKIEKLKLRIENMPKGKVR